MSGESLRVEFRRQVRERVLDAAHDQTVERGWDQVRIGEVAVASGVSRPTLYREFGTKDGVGEALVAREAERFFAAITEVLAGQDDVAEGVRAATTYTLEAAEANPLLHAVLTGSRTGDTSLLPFLTTRSDAILAAGRALVADWARRTGSIDAGVAEEVADAAVRLVISHLVVPGPPPGEVAGRVARLVRAYLSWNTSSN
jgi:AcrR family transcriptional regulator